ncbi:MAG TPA: stress response translation initiation inhibitor YciH [Candidatus Nanoarchaeia archaeon]|nr:stress response translation initiation inhibitor YciH [Candidatus Nanoarchaeia archaeon]
MDVCANCGLPKDLCVCESIAREKQKIEVTIEKRKFGKQYTIIRGISSEELDLDDLLKKLKNKLACGGTVKTGTFELQGNHQLKIKHILKEMGFPEETIEVKQR